MALTKLNDRQLNAIGSNNIATDQELVTAINEHVAATNPHTQYANAAALTTLANNVVTSFNGSKGVVVFTTESISAINTNKLATAGGVATLDNASNVPVSQLINYSPEFLEFSNFSSLPITGNQSKYYITLDDGKYYSWANGNYTEEVFGWEDLIGDIKPRTNGVYAPVLKNLTVNNTEFSYSVGDKCECKYHIPHNYVPKSDLYIHAHWTHSGTNLTGSFVLKLYSTYSKGHQQDTFTHTALGSISVSGLNITNTPTLAHRVDEVIYSTKGGSASLLDTNLIEVDGFILLTFETDTIPSISGSPYTDDVYIISLDIHYRSTDLPTKNKSPNFYS